MNKEVAMKNKKAMSTLVVTVIMIALVLVAVGVVWAVYRGLLGSGTKNIELQGKCLPIDVIPTVVICDTSALKKCDVTLSRTGSSTEVIGGVALVFKDATGTASGVIYSDGDVPALSGRIVQDAPTGLTSPNRVEATAYFLDEAGKKQLCQKTNGYNF